MPMTATAAEFLSLLRQSGLLSSTELVDYLVRLPNAEQMPPTELADHFVRDGLLTPFQAQHLLRGRYKNFIIGKYKIIEPLGTGGMSQVFLCEHTVMKHRVALKLLPLKDHADPALISRFQREARAAAAVNHPNVVRAHDVDQADGRIHYLVMDYVDGVNLHDLVRRIGPLPPEQAAHYIAQAALGLQEIASKGLIHRDLKPSNLLLDREGVIRILDLGLARFADEGDDAITRQYSSETVFGTADYLAPEQALQSPDVDTRADIYSLGATLYFLLAGRAPFEDASTAQKLLAHQIRDPEPIEGVPAALQQVIRTMMRKNPAERYPTPYDVAEALASWARLPMPLPPDDFFPKRCTSVDSVATNGATGAPSTAGHGKTLPGGRGFVTTRIVHAPPAEALCGRLTGRLGQNNSPSRWPLIAGIAIGLLGCTIGALLAAGGFTSK